MDIPILHHKFDATGVGVHPEGYTADLISVIIIVCVAIFSMIVLFTPLFYLKKKLSLQEKIDSSTTYLLGEVVVKSILFSLVLLITLSTTDLPKLFFFWGRWKILYAT